MPEAEPPAPQPPTPLIVRLLALVALVALLSSAAWSSWAILSGRADFRARAREPVETTDPAIQR